MNTILNLLIDGLSLGGIYALIALGYTMVYGIAKMLNFAHGDIIMVGAYAIVCGLSFLGHPLLAILLAVVVCTCLGVIVEECAYRPLRGASPLAVLITAIGVSYLLQGIAQIVFGSASIPVNLLALGAVDVAGAKIQISSLLTLGLCIVIMVSLTLFIRYSKIGRAMLAVSEDRQAAQLMGINTNGIIMLTFAMGSFLAALASTFYLLRIPSVSPTFGSMPGIIAFSAAVIGGIGSIPGAMIGGIFLGLVEKIAQSIDAVKDYTTAIEFGLLVIILLIRPTGFLGKKKREKV